jgi:hypothetical protein
MYVYAGQNLYNILYTTIYMCMYAQDTAIHGIIHILAYIYIHTYVSRHSRSISKAMALLASAYMHTHLQNTYEDIHTYMYPEHSHAFTSTTHTNRCIFTRDQNLYLSTCMGFSCRCTECELCVCVCMYVYMDDSTNFMDFSSGCTERVYVCMHV